MEEDINILTCFSGGAENASEFVIVVNVIQYVQRPFFSVLFVLWTSDALRFLLSGSQTYIKHFKCNICKDQEEPFKNTLSLKGKKAGKRASKERYFCCCC